MWRYIMPKGSPELTNNRKNEIIDACAKLYETMGFKEITLKEIGTVTSFSRPSIYNYFKTKEEIFLGLLDREYDEWTNDINNILSKNESLSDENLASELAKTLEKRENLLKISAMNLYEIEDNSSLERLEEYKVAFKRALDAVCECIDKFLPKKAEEKKALIQYGFFPFIYGIYPYTTPTDKQMEAMRNVGVKFQAISVYEITYRFLCQLFR